MLGQVGDAAGWWLAVDADADADADAGAGAGAGAGLMRAGAAERGQG
ncbi:hypothetical protein ABZ719_07690 [Streptomyces sp. NPDC006743]